MAQHRMGMLVVLAAPIGMEAAISASGPSHAIAEVIMTISGSSPYIALTEVFLSTVLLTDIITNAAAAAFMFPIAVAISLQLNANFTPFIIIVMLGTSYAFINPAGYQTNLMVQAPGGYQFGDYTKLGIPLTLIVGAVAILMSMLIYGF
jgi:di/tricarboxylate transporter